MPPIEFDRLYAACLVLAKAIEDGKISGVVDEIKEILCVEQV